MTKNAWGALVMGVYWFVAGFVGGMVMEMYDPDGKIADIWPAVLGYPAFFGGLLFWIILRIAEKGRTFAQIPLTRAAVWGATAGLLLPVLFLLAMAVGFADRSGEPLPANFWQQLAAGLVLMVAAMALAGSASVAIGRRMADGLRTLSRN